MKFKKVEIQAFRAYDKVEDGTFDFTINGNDFADFIAIYAPNGFGKTSFYDAVEWGVTQSIHRLVQKKFTSDQAKSEKNENSATKHYLLRNKHSSPNTKSFVKLYTTDPNVKGFELKEPRKGQSDFKFLDNKSPFQKVILSQEWIDAFLREDEPQNRYKTFIDYFGDKELDDYYKSIIALHHANELNIKTVKESLNGLQLDLKYDGDRKILETTNKLISELNAKGEQITEIDILFTDSDASKISQTVIKRTATLESSIAIASSKIRDIETVYTGNTDLINLEEFQITKGRIKDLEKDINELQRILKRYQGLGELKNHIQSIENLQTEKLSKRKTLDLVLEQFKAYEKTNQKIAMLLREQEQIKSSIALVKERDDEYKKKAVDLTAKKQVLNKQIATLTSRQQSFPAIRLDWQNNITKLKEVIESINNLDNPLKNARKHVEEVEEKNTLLNKYKSLIDKDVQSLEVLMATSYEPVAKSIIEHLTYIGELEKQIALVDKAIEQNRDLNNDIQDVVSKGLDIINSTTKDTCPLCTTKFKSHEDLIKKIVTNEVLSTQLQVLLDSKSELDKQKTTNYSAVNTLSKALINDISNDIRENTIVLTTAKKEFATLLDEEKKLNSQLRLLRSEEQELTAKCPYSEIEAEEKKVKDQISQINLEIEEVTKALADNTKSGLETAVQIQSQTELLRKSDVDLQECRENKSYKDVLTYFSQNYPKQPIVMDVLDKQINLIEDELSSLITKKESTNTAINNINVELSSTNKSDIEAELEKRQMELSINRRKSASFEQNFLSSFSINIELTELDFDSFLNNLRNNLKEEIKENNARISQLSLLRQLVDDVVPFLKFEKAKESQEVGEKRLVYLEKTVRKTLLDEKKKVSDHLNQMVNSFFYEDLINDLYKRIDPHPDYKKIKFKCDFYEDKPSLNIFVTDSEGKMMLIPNLYFSTAQLNILSLSIFLAKALNAKDEKKAPIDCIFIDDPIQSMDSINILSTIDLMRSIVFNQGKQIVLSTHDDNFFNLLQKKIPPEKFKSKYIELETFGKVKQT